MIIDNKYLEKSSYDQQTSKITLDMYELIQVNNQLINRLIKEIHYLTNSMLEQERIIKEIRERFNDKYKYIG